jgi:hypothetical protein
VQARDSIVTPQTPQIQELIRQIDEALRKSSPRLPWLQSAEVAHQRQVLQQTRSYLVGLQQQTREAEERPLTGSKPQPFPESSAETAQQVLQAVLQEMNYLRTNMLQPLRSDIDTLQHRRDLLAQEIQQLEAQKQQALPPANSQVVTEFLQSSMQQLQDNLTGQVAHMLAGLSVEQPLLGSGDALTPAQRLQHMQQIQNQSDQLMMRLDSAIRIIFESMQTNIQSYEDSLEQGLNRMHTLGQQGEAMFSALVNRLAEHLGRETSTYLQSSIQVDTPTSGFLQESQTEIDQLLGELNALDDALEQAAPEFDEFDPTIDPLAFLSTPPDISDEEITLFQHDFEDDEITQFQDGSELEPTALSSNAPTPDLSSAMDLLNQLNGDDSEPDREEAIANDEFYQSLFGEAQEETEAVPETIPESIPEPISESVSESISAPISETGTDPIAEAVSESIADEGSELAESPDMSDLFFSGMGDPATVAEEAEEAPETPDYPAADLPQSVESFLLRAPEPEAPPVEAVETIHSLADLLGSPEETIAQPAAADQNLDENSYEPARAEENLLAQDDSQRVMLDPDSLSIDARQLLESDLSALENAALVADTAADDMTLFDQDQTDLPFPTDDSGDRAGLTLDGFDFADETPSASGLTLDGFELNADAPESDLRTPSDFNSPAAPDPSDAPDADSIPTHAMSQESSTPFAQDSSANAFSFEGLDDELFEPTPESKPLEPETLLKKKRPRSKGEPGRGFGR